MGPTYGRKTLTGLMASDGIRIAEDRVGEALKIVCPEYHQARQQKTERRLNPIPYHATHFGHKLHIDQNEKLVCVTVTLYMHASFILVYTVIGVPFCR